MNQAYPLSWPQGWPRTDYQKRAKFTKTSWQQSSASPSGGWNTRKSLSVADATARILRELEMLDVSGGDAIISTNIKLRLDGRPRSDQGEPSDHGVAVYWTRAGSSRQEVMAIDSYDRVADNMAAIAATLEAMRAIKRHGGAQILERAFTGFTALSDRPHWATILGVSPKASIAEVEAAFRSLAAKYHPDRTGGDGKKMAEISEARDRARKELETA